MIIKSKIIYELYRTNHGGLKFTNHGVLDIILKQYPDGTCSVSSLDRSCESVVMHRMYSTRRGAMIAIGKIFGKGNYRFKSMWSE